MENFIKASIIITTYNRPQFLSRAIESCISQQTEYSFEIIVVDDNGITTPNQIENSLLVQQYKEVNYIPLEKNSGACIARNIGVEHAVGDYIFFLDDDDEFMSHKLQTQIHFMDSNCNLAGCLGAFMRIEDKIKKEIVSISNFPVIGDYKNFIIYGNFFTPMLCIKKEIFLHLKGFDSIARFQDRFFMLKALRNGYHFGTIDQQLHIMYEHDQSRITDNGIKTTIASLDTIKAYIIKDEKPLNSLDWKLYLIKDYRMRATTFYISSQYSQRVKAIPFFIKSFMISKESKDFMMIIKSLIKFR